MCKLQTPDPSAAKRIKVRNHQPQALLEATPLVQEVRTIQRVPLFWRKARIANDPA